MPRFKKTKKNKSSNNNFNKQLKIVLFILLILVIVSVAFKNQNRLNEGLVKGESEVDYNPIEITLPTVSEIDTSSVIIKD